jgi:hypothetical protein
LRVGGGGAVKSGAGRAGDGETDMVAEICVADTRGNG